MQSRQPECSSHPPWLADWPITHTHTWLICLFFLVKGQTVTPKARPPHGPLLITDVKKDDPVYKGNRINEIPVPYS